MLFFVKKVVIAATNKIIVTMAVVYIYCRLFGVSKEKKIGCHTK